MKREDQGTLSKLIEERKQKEATRPKNLTKEQKSENIVKWTTFYRRNWNLYATQRLGIKLHPFQHIMLYLIGVSNTFMAICGRGISKTFTVGLASFICALLYPYSEIHLTSMTMNQSKKMVKDKMENELCNKLSPVLKWMKENDLIAFHYGKEEIRIDFNVNGSKMWIDVADDSARGGRSTFSIFEECRLLKKNIVDSVFLPMAHPRQAVFLTNPKYAGDERWLEECKNIYITSARFKNEWFWTTFKKIVTECINNKKIAYNFFASDIFVSIMFGLKTKADFLKSKATSTELNFRMEDLNEMIGEAEDSFFGRDDFKKNQLICTAFKPPTIHDIISQIEKNRPKEDNEYRILFVDLAFANSTSKSENDNTVIGCMFGKYNDYSKKISRGVEYLTTCNGGDSKGTERLIRELYWKYKCDYIVMDTRNGGETYINNLSMVWEHPEYPKELWNPHGFTAVNDIKLNMVTQQKLDDVRSRAIDPQAIPCIIPITATPEYNNSMWLDLQKRLRDEDIEFLIEDTEFLQGFEETAEYFKLSSEQKLEITMPYTQTMLLIHEAVNLSQEWREGKVRLTEPRTGTKDRIVACGYGNYFFTLLENSLAIQSQSDDDSDIDWDNISLVV